MGRPVQKGLEVLGGREEVVWVGVTEAKDEGKQISSQVRREVRKEAQTPW